jgi:hypothetical protein
MLPLLLFIFSLFEHTYNIYILLFECRSCFPRGVSLVEGLLWVAELKFELGPALQQADALLSEPRRTLVSHAAP